jgi:hypothetical protein
MIPHCGNLLRDRYDRNASLWFAKAQQSQRLDAVRPC